MVVVDASEVVEEGVLEERHAVLQVHDEIESGESEERRGSQLHSGRSDEANGPCFPARLGRRRDTSIPLGIPLPENGNTVDERVDLEMNGQTQNPAGQDRPPG